ncbi:MAG: hypothetical protein IJT18_02795 [Oscillospiraceae bacterium]|nr:hypothetical protein [Oscillospiraceae bacterium]
MTAETSPPESWENTVLRHVLLVLREKDDLTREQYLRAMALLEKEAAHGPV